MTDKPSWFAKPHDEAPSAPGPAPRDVDELTWEDRFRGAILGGAVGDVLGAPVRNRKTADIQQWFAARGVVDYLPVFGRRGAGTDLTQLTAFTLEALLRAKALNPDSAGWLPTQVVGTNHLRWLYTQGVPWQYAMSAHLSTQPEPQGWLLERPELFSTRNPTGAALRGFGELALAPRGANGEVASPPMGSTSVSDPIVWAAPTMVWNSSEDLVFAAGASIAGLLTEDSDVQGAAGLHCDVLAQLIRGVSLWDAVSASDNQRLGRAHYTTETPAGVRRMIHAAMFASAGGRRPGPAELDIEFDTDGKPGELGIALTSVAATDSFASAVRMAVNQSADSCVTGALAGQLAGALHGPDAIPLHWIEELELGDILETLCTDAAEAFAPPPVPKWAQRYVAEPKRAFSGPLLLPEGGDERRTYSVISERVHRGGELPQREALEPSPLDSSPDADSEQPLLLPRADAVADVQGEPEEAALVDEHEEDEPSSTFVDYFGAAYEPPRQDSAVHEVYEPYGGPAPGSSDFEGPAFENGAFEHGAFDRGAFENGAFESGSHERFGDESSHDSVPHEGAAHEDGSYDEAVPDRDHLSASSEHTDRGETAFALPQRDTSGDPAFELPAYSSSSFDSPSPDGSALESAAFDGASYATPPHDVPPYDGPSAASSSYSTSYDGASYDGASYEWADHELYESGAHAGPSETRLAAPDEEADSVSDVDHDGGDRSDPWGLDHDEHAREQSPVGEYPLPQYLDVNHEPEPATTRSRSRAKVHARTQDPEPVSPSLTERVLGALLGGGLGNALGADLETATAEQIAERFGPPGPRPLSNLPRLNEVGGAVSGDTQMALFTAEGLIRGSTAARVHGATDPLPEVQLAYQRWLHTRGVAWQLAAGAFHGDHPLPDGWLVSVPGMFDPPFPDNTVFESLVRFGQGRPIGSVLRKINDSKGCGGLTRAAPAALHSSDPSEVFELAVRTAALTHGHPSGYLPAGALAVIVQQALLGRTLDDGVWLALQVLETWDGHEETSALLKAGVELASQGMPAPQQIERTLGSGWVAEQALAIAVCAALVAEDDFELAMRVSVHHSGDSDSTGAVCGNIVGALLGVEALPVDRLAELKLREVLQQMALDCVAEFGGPEFGMGGDQDAGQPTDEDWMHRYPVRAGRSGQPADPVPAGMPAEPSDAAEPGGAEQAGSEAPSGERPEARLPDAGEVRAPKPAPRRISGIAGRES